MDIDKLQKLIAEIAKQGDKKTLGLVAELLTEISKYEKKTTTKEPIREPVKESINESNSTTMQKASSVLDMLGSFEKPRTRQEYTAQVQQPVFRPSRIVQQEDYTSAFSSILSNLPQQNSVPVSQPAPIQTRDPDIPEIPYEPGPPIQGFDSNVTGYAALL